MLVWLYGWLVFGFGSGCLVAYYFVVCCCCACFVFVLFCLMLLIWELYGFVWLDLLDRWLLWSIWCRIVFGCSVWLFVVLIWVSLVGLVVLISFVLMGFDDLRFALDVCWCCWLYVSVGFVCFGFVWVVDWCLGLIDLLVGWVILYLMWFSFRWLWAWLFGYVLCLFCIDLVWCLCWWWTMLCF